MNKTLMNKAFEIIEARWLFDMPVEKIEVLIHRVAKAIGTAALLAKGIPMLFMGQEAGEHEPFHFGQQSYLRLDEYEQSDSEMHHIYRWFQHMMGLRRR